MNESLKRLSLFLKFYLILFTHNFWSIHIAWFALTWLHNKLVHVCCKRRVKCNVSSESEFWSICTVCFALTCRCSKLVHACCKHWVKCNMNSESDFNFDLTVVLISQILSALILPLYHSWLLSVNVYISSNDYHPEPQNLQFQWCVKPSFMMN